MQEGVIKIFQGSNITKLRDEHNISQEELADLLNIHVTTLSRWENNHAESKASHIKRLCEIFQITESELLSAPQDERWVLEIKVDNSKKEMIDMTNNMPCVAQVSGTQNGACLTLAGKWEIFADEAKFQEFIEQIKNSREKILNMKKDWF